MNGTWKIDRTKSVASNEWPLLVVVKLNIRGDSLVIDRLYETNDGQQYPFTEKLKLDGKEINMTIYDMPRRVKATWSEQNAALNVETTTTFYGNSGTENFVSVETWKADKASGTLTAGFKNKISSGEAEGKLVFIK